MKILVLWNTLKKIVDKERKNNGLEPLPEQTEEKKEIAEEKKKK
mgnify:CR=1 FL=1